MISIQIDGKEIKTEEKKTILQVARENGIYIPTLCYHEHLLPIGSCRLCVVEIEGFDKPQTSCTTYVAEGMKVVTKSDRLFQMRREFLKFILMEHPLDCPQCDKAGECRLQDLVYEHSIEKAGYKIQLKKERLEVFSTPLIRKWPKRCVLCLRCYHACKEISGRGVLGINGGGIHSKIEVVKADDCISCGECLSVCPVGSLTENLSPKKTRPWMADQTVIDTCPHCGFGCTLLLVSQNGYLRKVKTDEKLSPNYGSLCVRGRFGYDFANSELRIKESFSRIYDEKRTLSLEEAERELVSKIKNIEEEGGAIGFLVSPRLTNEEVQLILEMGKLFKRTYFSSSCYYFPYKLLQRYKLAGIPYGYDYDDIEKCDLVIVVGADLLLDNHLLGVKIREALKNKGIRIVTIDQYDGSLSSVANLCLRVRPATEYLLIDSIALNLIKEGRKNTEVDRFEEYKRYLFALDEKEIIDLCEIREEEIKELMDIVKGSEKIGIVFGSGIRGNGIDTIINFSFLTGASLFPVIEQANGIGVSAILQEMIDPMQMLTNNEIKGILIFEEEPSQYVPNHILLEAYKNKYIVHFSFLPTEVTKQAHLVFPFSGFHEKDGTYISGCGKIGRLGKKVSKKIDSVFLLKDLILKLGGGASHEDVVTNVKHYLREERKEKAYIVSERTEKVKRTGFLCTFRDLFKNPYVRYSDGINLVDADKVYISRKDADTLSLKEGDEVKIENAKGSIRRKVSIQEGMVEGVILFKPHFDFEFIKLFEDLDKPVEVKVEKV